MFLIWLILKGGQNFQNYWLNEFLHLTGIIITLHYISVVDRLCNMFLLQH